MAFGELTFGARAPVIGIRSRRARGFWRGGGLVSGQDGARLVERRWRGKIRPWNLPCSML